MQHERRAVAWLLSALVLWAAAPLAACSAHDPDPTPRKSSEALSECPDDAMPDCAPGSTATCMDDGTWVCVKPSTHTGDGSCSTCRRWL